ncbi:MAG: hypothetical protein ACTSPD_09010 [Promethearchaeota archaeon]
MRLNHKNKKNKKIIVFHGKIYDYDKFYKRMARKPKLIKVILINAIIIYLIIIVALLFLK